MSLNPAQIQQLVTSRQPKQPKPPAEHEAIEDEKLKVIERWAHLPQTRDFIKQKVVERENLLSKAIVLAASANPNDLMIRALLVSANQLTIIIESINNVNSISHRPTPGTSEGQAGGLRHHISSDGQPIIEQPIYVEPKAGG